MIIFHEQVYVGPLVLGTSVSIHTRYAQRFGYVDSLHISGYASQISSTFVPELTLSVKGSFDGSTWNVVPSGPNTFSLAGTSEILFQMRTISPVLSPTPPIQTIVMSLGGVQTFVGRLSLWVTGRDSARRARSLAANVGS